MKHEINFSIIIPHKNIPGLLQRCLDSIPRRDDVQIIIVDDNSDPEIVDFDKFPGLNDPFVEVVFTKEGKGAGHARNVGLTKAVGKWLLFADADDFYNYCIKDILDEYVNSDADIIFFKHNSLDSKNYTTTYRCTRFCTFIDKWLQSNPKDDAPLRYKLASVWAKLIKHELIKKNNILFDEVSLANDVTFAYLSGFYAASINADPRALYCTTIRRDSIRHKKKNIKNELDNLYVICKRYRFFREHHIHIPNSITPINSLIKIYLYNREYFHKAKEILHEFGFTSGEIIKLFTGYVLFLAPNKLWKKLFVRTGV